MKSQTLSLIALVIFLCSLALFRLSPHISQETLLKSHEDKFRITEKLSDDRLLELKQIDSKNIHATSATAMNHNRTLRAFFVTNSDGQILVIERAHTNDMFVLSGPFAFASDTPLHFVSPTAISFTVMGSDGVFEEYVIDVHSLAYEHHVVSQNLRVRATADNLPID